MEIPEVTQTLEGQKQKLQVVLDEANRILEVQSWQQPKWSVDSKINFSSLIIHVRTKLKAFW